MFEEFPFEWVEEELFSCSFVQIFSGDSEHSSYLKWSRKKIEERTQWWFTASKCKCWTLWLKQPLSRSRKRIQNFLICILSFKLKIERLQEQESPVRHLTPCRTSLPCCIASWTTRSTISQGRSFVHMFQSIAENWFWPLVPQHSARSCASWYPTPLDPNAEFFWLYHPSSPPALITAILSTSSSAWVSPAAIALMSLSFCVIQRQRVCLPKEWNGISLLYH